MSKKQLLIVDDNDSLREALRTVFEDEYELDFAASGEEALMKYHRRVPQVVLMDYKMPGLDGLETLQRLQTEAQKSPVVLMSAYDESQMADSAIKFGAAEFVCKPFAIDQIKNVIERALDTNRTVQTTTPRRLKAQRPIEPVMSQNEVDELIDQAMRLTSV